MCGSEVFGCRGWGCIGVGVLRHWGEYWGTRGRGGASNHNEPRMKNENDSASGDSWNIGRWEDGENTNQVAVSDIGV